MADSGQPGSAAPPSAPASNLAPFLALRLGAAFWGGTWPVARSLIEAPAPRAVAEVIPSTTWQT